MDTMTATKVLCGFCGALLIYLLGNWAAEEIYHVGGGHGGEYASGYAIEVAEAEDAVSYIIESRDNFSRPWEILESFDYTKAKMTYEISNLSGGFHYYRIISIDRMGYQNADMEGEFLEIFIDYENINSATSGSRSSNVINNYIIVTSLLVLTAITSAAYFFRNKKDEVEIPKLLFSEHHLSHAAAAFYPSPFEESVILCMDGVGEWATTTVAVGKKNGLEIKKEIHFPHSLGLLYSAFTYYTGFKVNSGEYKLMGLAPYGEPKYTCLLYTSPSPRDRQKSRMPSSA